MGWNTITRLASPLFAGIKENSYVYYVHSYYAELSLKTIAATDYLISYSAAIQQDNFYGVQFHSEKSAGTGIRIISNFLNLV
jgi:glutamine amidotransferase